jgi:V8-like Glu-specific endopeptidase
MVWKDVLETAAKGKKTRGLVQLAYDEHSDNPKALFLRALLDDTEPVRDAEPRGQYGAPRFVKDNDLVTENEALLFKDDLTLEIGRVPWLITTLQKLQTLAPAVCRLEVKRGPQSQHGTGFRIGPDLLLTNWHVLTFKDELATEVKAQFGYEDDGKGGTLGTTAIGCDVGTIVGDKANDWAAIRAGGAVADTIPTLKLSEAADPVLNAPAFIIQHPGGGLKKLAFVRNQVTAFTDRVVHYLSDTRTGSSGSPVLNDAGRLIALHHAGGRPQELAGKPPMAKNEGIRIPAVLKGLGEKGIMAT